jgi:hypothetical protein
LDHVKQLYHFVGISINGKFITVDVYAILCEFTTQLQLAYFMVIFLEDGSEVYSFISNCSKALYYCPTGDGA